MNTSHYALSETLNGKHLLLFLLLVLAATSMGLPGTVSLPMDAHEVLVVQTAQEMFNRGDWVVPWFNDQPRLNKPPLSYWMTGLTAYLTHSLDNIQGWHGRLVSLAAGIGIVICTFVCGLVLFNRRFAFLSASILITTSAWFTYTHDARPDMLYSFFCTLSMSAFVLVLKSGARNQYSSLWSCLIWISLALAILTKGPQMPLAYLIGMLVICRIWKYPIKTTLEIMRPVTGVLILILLALPWWLYLDARLDSEHLRLEGTQLSGTLLTINPANWLKLYYLYRPLVLLLPWIFLIPFSILWIRKKSMNPEIWFILVMIIAPAMVLGLGSQQRWYYMLPSLMPMCLFLAIGMEELIDRFFTKRIVSLLMIIAMFLTILVITTLVTFENPGGQSGHIIYLAMVLFQLSVILLSIPGFHLLPGSIFPILFLIVFSGFIYMGISLNGWNSERFQRRDLALKSLSAADPDSRYLNQTVNPSEYVFYTGKFFKSAGSRKTINEVRHDSSVILLTRPEILKSLTPDYQFIGQVGTDKKITEVAVYFPKLDSLDSQSD